MPGGLQPKKAAKLAHKVLGVPVTLQGYVRKPKESRPKSRVMNTADIQPDDSGVGSWTNYNSFQY